MKNLYTIILICSSFILSGCSTKVYYSPEIDIVVKDSETKEVIYNANLFNLNYDKSLNIENDKPLISSSKDGSIFKKATYSPTTNQKNEKSSYSQGRYLLSHPSYNSYILHYNCNDINKFCTPKIKNISNDLTKKNILFECDGCNKVLKDNTKTPVEIPKLKKEKIKKEKMSNDISNFTTVP